MDTIHIGLLRDDEVESLQTLAQHIWRTCYPAIISHAQIDYMLAQRYTPALLRQQRAQGDPVFVARDGARLVGFAHACLTEEGRCKLDKLYVSPERQRQGVGSRLLTEVQAFARRQGCATLFLRVNKHNGAALAAYRKHGFVIQTALTEDIGGGFVMDDYLMVKTL